MLFIRSLSLIAGLLTTLLASQSSAALVTYTYTGASQNIPNNNATGVDLDIDVTDTFDLLSFESVSLTMTHNDVSDLRITLTHVPSGSTIFLMNRPGSTTVGGAGDDSNLSGTYTFTNATTTRIIDAAALVGNNATIPTGNYAPTNNLFNGVGGPTYTGEQIQNLGTTFNPISNLSGIWRLNVADVRAGQNGSISAFSFTVDAAAIPEPSSMLLLGSTLLLGSGWHYRRRKQSKPAESIA